MVCFEMPETQLTEQGVYVGVHSYRVNLMQYFCCDKLSQENICYLAMMI